MKLKDFENEYAMQRIAELNSLTGLHGWKHINTNVATKLVSYAKIIDGGATRMDIYYTTMTVSIALNHPKKGKTQLHRKHVTDEELKRLLENPRAHTGKGYYKRRRSISR
jgi:hypothetical protein